MEKIEILFENEDFIAANKPEGLLTIKGRGIGGEENLFDLLKKNLGKIYTVHRLDRDASGIVVFAKNPGAHKYLGMMFEKRLVKKKYYAFVRGNPRDAKGRIDTPVKDGSRRCSVHFEGKKSITDYFVLKRYDKIAFVELSPLTGRRHQLRVHMNYINHPILGDRLYGNLREQAVYPRLLLHCFSIEFSLPSANLLKLRKDPPQSFFDIPFSV